VSRPRSSSVRASRSSGNPWKAAGVDWRLFNAARGWRLLRTDSGFRVLGTPPSDEELERALKAAGARKGAVVEVGEEELELA